MKGKKHYSAEQITRLLSEANTRINAGQTIAMTCQALGIAESTFHRWRTVYGAMSSEEAKRLKELEKENAKLKCMVAEQVRSTQRCIPVLRQEEVLLLLRIEHLVRENPRCGYRRITAMLRLEGWHVNHKRVHRLWKQEGYRVPTPKKKSKVSGSSAHACNKKIANGKNDIWTYDFIFDRLGNGRALKILAVTDEYTRGSLAYSSVHVNNVIDGCLKNAINGNDDEMANTGNGGKSLWNNGRGDNPEGANKTENKDCAKKTKILQFRRK